MQEEYPKLLNLSKWHLYMRGIGSPQLYVDFGFYYLVAAALQRRVWYGPPEKPLFPNLYVTFVGRSGIGKGLVIQEVTKIISHHKKPKFGSSTPAPVVNPLSDIPANQVQILAAQITDLQQSLKEAAEKKAPKGNDREKLLIPLGADSITFQGLLEDHGYANIRNTVVPCKMAPNGTYSHQSICFSLEELSSLFRKNLEDLVTYLQIGFDCQDFRYKTKTCGEDILKRTCINMLAGTTPAFMSRAFDMDILNQGIASRMLFVYASRNRFEQFDIPHFTEEQLHAHAELLASVKLLTTVFGQVTFTPEAQEYAKHYFEKEFPAIRDNAPAKLQNYYARKKVITIKLMMVLHLSDWEYHQSMEIPLATLKMVLGIMSKVETTMLYALNYGTENKLPKLGSKILEYLRGNEGKSFTKNELWRALYGDVDGVSHLEEAISGLEITGQIDGKSVEIAPGRVVIKYQANKELMTGEQNDRPTNS